MGDHCTANLIQLQQRLARISTFTRMLRGADLYEFLKVVSGLGSRHSCDRNVVLCAWAALKIRGAFFENACTKRTCASFTSAAAVVFRHQSPGLKI